MADAMAPPLSSFVLPALFIPSGSLQHGLESLPKAADRLITLAAAGAGDDARLEMRLHESDENAVQRGPNRRRLKEQRVAVVSG